MRLWYDNRKGGVRVELLYHDREILVCIKEPGMLSTDEPGGLPSLVRQALGDEKADVRTVHRLDRVVSGVMVLARNPKAASELSRQIRNEEFQKEYLAVIHADGNNLGITIGKILQNSHGYSNGVRARRQISKNLEQIYSYIMVAE